MIYEMPLPSLGADMDEAKFLSWRVKAGDQVQKGQIVAEIETTKAAVEIEAFRSGKVVELLAKPDEVIAVGKIIARFEVEGQESVAATAAQPAPVQQPSIQQPPTQKTAEPAKPGEMRLRISPAARRFAEENKIDLKSTEVVSLKGSGPDGAIELKDLQTLKPASSDGFQNIRQAIAKAMARSKASIPHYYLKLEVNVESLVAHLDKINADRLPADRYLLPAATAFSVTQALKKNADFNGYFVDDKFQKLDHINLGLAVSLKTGGVMVPAVLESEAMNFENFNAAFKDLVQRTRDAKLKNREITEGTVTITNLGDLGADEVQGIIFPPQVAIVGMGRVRRAPASVGEQIQLQSLMTLTLSADHRVTDGISGSKFLRDIANLMGHPEKLLI